MESRLIDHQLVVRLDPGDRIIASLRECCVRNDVRAGFMASGVGMISNVELGFFDQQSDSYRSAKFEDLYDLTLLHGNVTVRDDETVVHAHIVMNDDEFHAFGGHLIEGTCEVTLELGILVLPPNQLVRKKVPGFPATRIVFP